MPTEYAPRHPLIRALGHQAYLLASLLALLILYPLLTSKRTAGLWLYGIMTLVVITGPMSLAPHRRGALLSFILAFGMWTTGWINAVIDTDLTWLISITGAAFFSYIAVLIFDQHLIKTDGDVDSETLVAAVNAYLCMGITFAFILFFINYLQPSAFSEPCTDAMSDNGRFERYIYLSFVTITTLGYGDITPQTAAARIATYLLAVVGQLYIALTVARVVGMLVAKQTR